MMRASINAPLARGVGRFFDGIGALALGRRTAAFEGQLAIAWNEAAAGEGRPYPFATSSGDLPEIDLRPLVRAAVSDVVAGVPPSEISARFHATLVAATIDRVRAAISEIGAQTVVLTGGAFHNPLLAEGVCRGLAGVDVRCHGEVPPGDGGIALGQALVADAQLRRHGRCTGR
jgi:hydrogenase maturation protein HypF